ncbi:MAG: AAA family ATPase [Lachnospiraceae bacterium]|nr:AAA family ATPase [Lachnospiraceae bacterium]
MRSMNFNEILKESGMKFSDTIDHTERKALTTFWEGLRKQRKDNISAAEIDEVLKSYQEMGVLKKDKNASKKMKGGDRSKLPELQTDAPGQILLAMACPEADITGMIGGFVEDEGAFAFEYKKNDRLIHLDVRKLDVRYRRAVTWLADNHAAVDLTGFVGAGLFQVTDIKAAEKAPEEDSLKKVSPDLVRTMVNHLRTAQMQPRHEKREDDYPLTRAEDLKSYLYMVEDTLPDNIRAWAYRTLYLQQDETVGDDERRHALRALSLMLSVQWKSTYFEPIDPVAAKKILDDELYGLESVKQRIIETIIQINRTHTLPFYGLLLVGPAGTGKSQIAYAVARILRLPFAVLDMSTIRDPGALTGSPRIYTNARPGRIMESFVQAGSSNVVFVINELDKAESDTSHGNSADSLLTLFDHLGFTDNYMECAIPTGGVYPIATANDRKKISGPLLSRFAVIDLPDYTPGEKKIIFLQYSMPKILTRLGMKKEECALTDAAVDKIIEHFQDVPGCRDLEQAAEHLAAHALYEIENKGVKTVTFDEKDVCHLLAL